MSYYRQGPHRPSGPGVRFGVPGLTPFVKILIIAGSSVWLVQAALFFLVPAFGGPRIDLSWVFGVVPALVVKRLFLWQPATSMFLHHPADIFHVLFNMLMLWMFGGELERHWGGRAFLRYYLVAGVGAGVVAVAWAYAVAGNVNQPTIGASGAIFGLIAAYGIVFGERTIYAMLLFPMKARTFALIFFAVNLFYTITQPYGGVSYISHVGGALVGYLYLKRAWRFGEFFRELRWKARRRRFKVMPPGDRDDFDRWVN